MSILEVIQVLFGIQMGSAGLVSLRVVVKHIMAHLFSLEYGSKLGLKAPGPRLRFILRMSLGCVRSRVPIPKFGTSWSIEGGRVELADHVQNRTVDGRNSAPPKNPPWFLMIPRKYQQTMVLQGLKLVQDFVHPQYVQAHAGFTSIQRVTLSY